MNVRSFLAVVAVVLTTTACAMSVDEREGASASGGAVRPGVERSRVIEELGAPIQSDWRVALATPASAAAGGTNALAHERVDVFALAKPSSDLSVAEFGALSGEPRSVWERLTALFADRSADESGRRIRVVYNSDDLVSRIELVDRAELDAAAAIKKAESKRSRRRYRRLAVRCDRRNSIGASCRRIRLQRLADMKR